MQPASRSVSGLGRTGGEEVGRVAEARVTARALLVRFLSASGIFHSIPRESARDRSRPSTRCFVSNKFRAIPQKSAEIPGLRPEKRGVTGSTPVSTTSEAPGRSQDRPGASSRRSVRQVAAGSQRTRRRPPRRPPPRQRLSPGAIGLRFGVLGGGGQVVRKRSINSAMTNSAASNQRKSSPPGRLCR